MHVREIRLHFVAGLWSPLNIGCTIACFHIAGICSLVCSGLWNSYVRAGVSSFATDCRRRQGMLSGPATFRWFSDTIYANTDLCNALIWTVFKSGNCGL